MYIILELQKQGDEVGSIVTKKDSFEEAMSTYYSILAAAAISQVDVHSAVIMDDEGGYINHETFQHFHKSEEL